MTLHTVGPETMAEDEQKIGKAYMTWLAPFLLFGPLVAIRYLDQKLVVWFCVGATLLLLHEIGGRLHDLCIRLRRTNILLRNQNPS